MMESKVNLGSMVTCSLALKTFISIQHNPQQIFFEDWWINPHQQQRVMALQWYFLPHTEGVIEDPKRTNTSVCLVS